MTDDAELRARIEAQVAARRADLSSSGTGAEALEADDAEPETTGRSGRSAKALTPTRPWQRMPSEAGEDAEPAAADTAADESAPTARRRGGLGPARPWAGRTPQADPTAEEPTGPTEDESESAVAGGRLRPARPWQGRAAAEPVRAETGEPTAPAPSHPDVVLRGITEGEDAPEDLEAPSRFRGLLQRGPVRRRDDDPAAAAWVEEQRREAERRLEELEQERLTAEQRRLAEQRAEAERFKAELDAQRRQAEGEPTTARHAAPAAEGGNEAIEPAPSGEATVEAPAVAAGDAAEEIYPWQRKEEVDPDLHGAPTWDPSVYPSEPDETEPRRAGRALRWLLARAPEPAVAAPTQQAEPLADVPVARLPVADVVAREPAAEPMPEVAPTADEDEEVAAAPPAKRAGRGFRRRLLGRRGSAAEHTDEQDEQFQLPAPDAAFDEPWLTPPRPTRDWSQRAPLEALREPGADDQAGAEVAPEPEREPVAEVVAEPVAEIVPEPAPEPEPEAPPEAPRPRPTPGPTAARRPSPGLLPAPEVVKVDVDPAGKRRPSPGAAATGVAARAHRPLPFELAGAAPSTRSRPEPDLSRFLKATEADDDEDDEKDDRPGKGGTGRWRRVLTHGVTWLIIAILAALLLRTFVVQPYYIPSASMEPTLHGCPGCNDDHVLVDKISYRIHDPRVGDIVVFHRPKNAQVPEDVLIKRIIAKGGDKIAIKKGQVFINGQAIKESYVNDDHSCYATDPAENFAARTVPEGDVFVMGDNRCNSDDSRDFGPIPTSSIIGRAFAIVWPLDRVGFLGS